jgi:hypothetical protein
MTKVRLEEVWQIFRSFDGFMETSYQSIANLIKLGITQDVLTSGVDENGRWIALENPRPQWAGTPILNVSVKLLYY